MSRPIHLTVEQEHARRFMVGGQTVAETCGIEVAVLFTPEPTWAAQALVDFDAKVAVIRKGIAAYTEEDR